MSRRLLLVSNSTNPGGGYLDHCVDDVARLFEGVALVAFVPYALHDLDGYATLAERRFSDLGIRLRSVHRSADPAEFAREADGFFVGGGNTFRLLDRTVRTGVLDAIRTATAAGAAYMGTSAGSNLACPTIKTTNDMPIVEPPTFEALGLVPFQINAHYVDRDPDVAHGGETREQRIAEFHEVETVPVVGLREGSAIRVTGDRADLVGPLPARVFLRGAAAREVDPGDGALDVLMGRMPKPGAGTPETL